MDMDNFFGGLTMPSLSPEGGGGQRYRIQKRLLYLVNHSFPFSSNGYAVRTHNIAKALVKSGLDVMVITRPGAIQDKGNYYGQHQKIDGVYYIHTFQSNGYDLSQSIEAVRLLIKVFKPSRLLAASNWENGLIAALAAKAMDVPFYYEVRGFWEITRASKDPEWGESQSFYREVECENHVAMAAEQIFTLNSHMHDELIQRGVNKPISLVPNGFSGWAEALPVPSISKADLGIKAGYLAGYIGSFNSYEGLEGLIEAIAMARHHGVDIALLLIGSSEPMGLDEKQEVCPVGRSYYQLAERLAVLDLVTIISRVKPEMVAEYYSILDVVLIPRKPVKVCEIVSPIKPLEAASYKKPVLMSNVAPLLDLSSLCDNFFYFEKGSVSSLSRELIKVLEQDYDLRECPLLEQYTWEANVFPMLKAFGEC